MHSKLHVSNPQPNIVSSLTDEYLFKNPTFSFWKQCSDGYANICDSLASNSTANSTKYFQY